MTIKTGIIGYGNMGKWHSETIRSCPEFDLVAVHDIRPERNRRAEEVLGVKGYDDLSDFLAHEGLELVVVVTPNNFHKPLACAAMEAGKNVICEKPVAMSLAELNEMIATSERCGVMFTIHHNRRWDSDFLTVKKAFEDGSIGKVFDVQSRVGGWSTGDAGWRGVAESGGGMLYDWGIHLLDQMVTLTGELPETVYAKVDCMQLKVDDYFKVQLRWPSGLTAEVEMSPRTAVPMPRWLVYGDKATIVIRDWGTGSAWTHKEGGKPVERPLAFERGDWRDYYAVGIFEALRKGKAPWVKPESARAVMMIIDACRRSSETGEVVRL